MRYEELAFVNQQLAGMLRSGIPLEGALRRLCGDMRRGAFRTELEALEADLARGTPLPAALASRHLPEFYVRMIQVGARSNDLPGVLTLVADYYRRAHLGWTRLKGLLVYPLVVLLASLAVSTFVALLCNALVSGQGIGLVRAGGLLDGELDGRAGGAGMERLLLRTWAPAVALGLVTLAACLALAAPAGRRYLRWRLPGFREQSLTHFASTMNLLLASGNPLAESLDLTGHLEAGTPAGSEVQRWKTRLADGTARVADAARDFKVFPPLFVWLLAQGGEDLAAGFRKAAEIYSARAIYRIEMLLHVALPVMVLALGTLILTQFLPLFRALIFIMDMLGSVDGPIGGP